MTDKSTSPGKRRPRSKQAIALSRIRKYARSIIATTEDVDWLNAADWDDAMTEIMQDCQDIRAITSDQSLDPAPN